MLGGVSHAEWVTSPSLWAVAQPLCRGLAKTAAVAAATAAAAAARAVVAAVAEGGGGEEHVPEMLSSSLCSSSSSSDQAGRLSPVTRSTCDGIVLDPALPSGMHACPSPTTCMALT